MCLIFLHSRLINYSKIISTLSLSYFNIFLFLADKYADLLSVQNFFLPFLIYWEKIECNKIIRVLWTKLLFWLMFLLLVYYVTSKSHFIVWKNIYIRLMYSFFVSFSFVHKSVVAWEYTQWTWLHKNPCKVTHFCGLANLHTIISPENDGIFSSFWVAVT